jgi:hypothetical protein
MGGIIVATSDFSAVWILGADWWANEGFWNVRFFANGTEVYDNMVALAQLPVSLQPGDICPLQIPASISVLIGAPDQSWSMSLTCRDGMAMLLDNSNNVVGSIAADTPASLGLQLVSPTEIVAGVYIDGVFGEPFATYVGGDIPAALVFFVQCYSAAGSVVTETVVPAKQSFSLVDSGSLLWRPDEQGIEIIETESPAAAICDDLLTLTVMGVAPDPKIRNRWNLTCSYPSGTELPNIGRMNFCLAPQGISGFTNTLWIESDMVIGAAANTVILSTWWKTQPPTGTYVLQYHPIPRIDFPGWNASSSMLVSLNVDQLIASMFPNVPVSALTSANYAAIDAAVTEEVGKFRKLLAPIHARFVQYATHQTIVKEFTPLDAGDSLTQTIHLPSGLVLICMATIEVKGNLNSGLANDVMSLQVGAASPYIVAVGDLTSGVSDDEYRLVAVVNVTAAFQKSDGTFFGSQAVKASSGSGVTPASGMTNSMRITVDVWRAIKQGQ